MPVPRSVTAFLLTGVVATVAGLLIERYVPDNRKSPVYSITKEDPNKAVFDEIDWMNRVQSTAKIIEARGSFYRCLIENPDFKRRTVTLSCTDASIRTTKAQFEHVHVD